MTDHYQTLGVDVNASAEDIKTAHRKKAAKEHPDRGGDPDKMAAVNKAYEVLFDPRRRLIYDQTGDDGGQSIEQQAKSALSEFFAQALQKDASSLLVAARQMVARMRFAAEKDVRLSAERTASFTARRAKIKSKSKVNLVHVLIDQALIDLKATADNAKEALEVADAVDKMLDDYESEEDAIITPSSPAWPKHFE